MSAQDAGGHGPVRNYLSSAIVTTCTTTRAEAIWVADANGWL